jgi:hypothetical protein
LKNSRPQIFDTLARYLEFVGPQDNGKGFESRFLTSGLGIDVNGENLKRFSGFFVTIQGP